VNAPGFRVALVESAAILVVAVHRLSAHTLPVDAPVLARAWIEVAAGAVHRQVQTAQFRLAGIRGALVTVSAVDGQAAGALSVHAVLAHDTGIQIVAGKALIDRQILADTAVGQTLGLQAGSILALNGRTLDNGLWGWLATVGNLGLVAEESPVAEIAVFIFLAVIIIEAIATHRQPQALAAETGIVYRAGVTIVAGILIGRKLAPVRLLAVGIGARIVVLTQDRLSQTLTVDTDVVGRAVELVVARDGIERLMETPGRVARVRRTTVVVLTRVFVGLSVAVIIREVADLR